jgi:hypothetical protein
MDDKKIEKYLTESSSSDKATEKEIRSFLKQVATGRYDEHEAFKELTRIMNKTPKLVFKRSKISNPVDYSGCGMSPALRPTRPVKKQTPSRVSYGGGCGRQMSNC